MREHRGCLQHTDPSSNSLRDPRKRERDLGYLATKTHSVEILSCTAPLKVPLGFENGRGECLDEDDRECLGEPQDTCSSALELSIFPNRRLERTEIRNTPVVAASQVATSVMDYIAPVVAEDAAEQGLYFMSKIGPYDVWAIKYGYSEFDPNLTVGRPAPEREREREREKEKERDRDRDREKERERVRKRKREREREARFGDLRSVRVRFEMLEGLESKISGRHTMLLDRSSACPYVRSTQHACTSSPNRPIFGRARIGSREG